MKVQDVTLGQLDFIVASCLGHILSYSEMYGLEIFDANTRHAVTSTDYTANWSDAGPVLEQMRSIGVVEFDTTIAFSALINGTFRKAEYSGNTLEACMRCFADVMLGGVVSSEIQTLLEKQLAEPNC